MELLKNGHGKSWKSHGISFPDVCGNPVAVVGKDVMTAAVYVISFLH